LWSFNPQIFQPAWFAAEGLIRKGEAEAAKIEIVPCRPQRLDRRAVWYYIS
jgi:hypothetical protein